MEGVGGGREGMERGVEHIWSQLVRLLHRRVQCDPVNDPVNGTVSGPVNGHSAVQSTIQSTIQSTSSHRSVSQVHLSILITYLTKGEQWVVGECTSEARPTFGCHRMQYGGNGRERKGNVGGRGKFEAILRGICDIFRKLVSDIVVQQFLEFLRQ